MATSIDSIQQKLFSRPLPPLEPGTKVWDKGLTKEIKGLKEHRFVIAGKSSVLHYPVNRLQCSESSLQGSPLAVLFFYFSICRSPTLVRLEYTQGFELMVALHLANDDIHHAHLIAQDSEGVSVGSF